MYFGSANRDPAKFVRPDDLDLSRADNPHIAFGGGAHVCLGQHIARIESDAMLIEVLSRMKQIETAGEPVWLPSNFISGPKAMPIRFKPGPRRH
jgi:cytochrome P450